MIKSRSEPTEGLQIIYWHTLSACTAILLVIKQNNNVPSKLPVKYSHDIRLRYQVVFSFPGARFPGSRPFSFPDFRELKRRYSREKRERVKDTCSLNETPDSYYSAFKRQLLVS